MNNKKIITAVILSVFIAATTAVIYFPSTTNESGFEAKTWKLINQSLFASTGSTDNSTELIRGSDGGSDEVSDTRAASLPYVTVLELGPKQTGTLSRFYTGTITPTRESELGFKRLGRVVKIYVDQGDTVSQGDLLAELDIEALESELLILAAQRSAAEAKLRELTKGPRLQTINAAKSTVAELKSLRDQAKSAYDRRRSLMGTNAISRQDLDDAAFSLSAAESKLQSQEHVVGELLEGTRPEQIEAQQSEVDRLIATIANIEIQLRESKLFAPYEAIIARRMIDEGTIIPPATNVFRLVEKMSPEAWIGIPPNVAKDLEVGKDYKLTCNGKNLSSTLRTILPELDQSTRTQTAIFSIKHTGEHEGEPVIHLGQIVQLETKTVTVESGYWLPHTALSEGERGMWAVYVAVPAKSITSDPSGDSTVHKVSQQSIEIVQIQSDRVLARGELTKGSKVILSGIQKLVPGQRIFVIPSDDQQR